MLFLNCVDTIKKILRINTFKFTLKQIIRQFQDNDLPEFEGQFLTIVVGTSQNLKHCIFGIAECRISVFLKKITNRILSENLL
jgi:hypothetical protein